MKKLLLIMISLLMALCLFGCDKTKKFDDTELLQSLEDRGASPPHPPRLPPRPSRGRLFLRISGSSGNDRLVQSGTIGRCDIAVRSVTDRVRVPRAAPASSRGTRSIPPGRSAGGPTGYPPPSAALQKRWRC